MAIKAVEMVRNIRDRHYEEMKGLTVEEQIKLVKEKSRKLQEKLKSYQKITVGCKS